MAYARALADVDVAIRLDPAARHYALRSGANRALGRRADAERDLAEARRLDPNVRVPRIP